MTTSRMEAFSDGVLAIIITIMVLELKAPTGDDLNALRPLIPVLLSYVISFVFVGIYWNNHHHMLQATHEVTGSILWANLHLLFWLSLVPFTTGWIGQTNFSAWPVAVYGAVLLFAGVAYYILERCIIRHHGVDSPLALAVGSDVKGWISMASYALAIPLAFVNRWLAVGIYILVAVLWLIPDRRIERTLHRPES